MDPLSALAIAATVVQFVDFGSKLVTKAWDIYVSGKKRVEEDEQLAEAERELSFLIDGIHAASANLPAPNTATPAQSQLLRMCYECDSVATQLNQIVDRIKEQREASLSGKARAPLRSGFKGRKSKDDIKEGDMEEIRRRLATMRHSIMDSVVLCLWDDSKRTKQWELHFSKQLDAVTSLIERVDETTQRIHQQSTLMPEDDFSTEQQTEIVRQELEDFIHGSRAGTFARDGAATAKLLVQASQSTSLKELGAEIIRALKDDSSRSIRSELIEFVWHKEWKLDPTMVNPHRNETTTINNHAFDLHGNEIPTTFDTLTVASAISKDVSFDTIETRESAITHTFEETYSWIFQMEPKLQEGEPTWYSFPRWLADENSTTYWVTGKPGSGKSTMMKFVIQNPRLRPLLDPWAGPLPLLIVSYYAWHAGSNLQKSLEGLKRTVISQALQLRPELAPILTPRRWALCQVLGTQRTFPAWPTWEIEESFDALLSECGKSIKLALFVDGLDEFEISAGEVVEIFHDIRTRCSRGLKLCVASRPWTEFDDEFHASPMLEMHRLTWDDMTAFVAGKFKDHRAFNEQKVLYPDATALLLEDIVDKADGVFLWVSVVVQHLLGLLASGRSIHNAKDALKTLPQDLSSLYDAIWASIDASDLPDASLMVQVVMAACPPLNWVTLWLIEESRIKPVDVDGLLRNAGWKPAALRSLRRKLSALTKGILEVSQQRKDLSLQGNVNFIHRTARDWARQSEVWQQICVSSPSGFDPFLALIEAQTLIVSAPRLDPYLRAESSSAYIPRTLWYASEVADSPANNEELVRRLDSFDSVLGQNDFIYPTPAPSSVPDTSPWPTKLCSALYGRMMENTFLGLAAQYSILPYIKSKSLSDRNLLICQKFSGHSLGLLENAIFGYKYYRLNESPKDFNADIPYSRRLATVKFLLDQGVSQSKAHVNYSRDIAYLKFEIAQRCYIGPDPEYYKQVADLMEKRDLKVKFKSMKLRVRSAIK